jgi:protein-tyrosine kinase
MSERSVHLVERAVAFLRRGAGLAAEAEAARGSAAAPAREFTSSRDDGPARRTTGPPAAVTFAPDAARVGFETMVRAGLSVAGKERSRIAEEYRVTVDRVLRGLRPAGNGSGRANLILVTSAKPGEGKTFTALNLAAAIVGNGLGEVLLVDMDTKDKSLTSQFGFTGAPGLLNLAANPAMRIDDLLLRTAVDGLVYLPVGTQGVPAPEGGVTHLVNTAVERIARRFARHLVVLDCAPCLSSSDSIMLAPLVDQVVMVVEAERTQRQEIESSLELIHACPNIALVLNKVQLTTSATFGAYYHHYYAPKP